MVANALLKRPMNYDDLAALPDDGRRYELINGEMIELTSPSLIHQFVSTKLAAIFFAFVDPRQLGVVLTAPLDVKLTPHNVVQPDIIFVSNERRRILRVGNFKLIMGAPDLLVEILSPSNRGYDVITKAALYAAFSVREYWLVDPETDSIQIRVLRDGDLIPLESPDGIARSEVLTGFAVDPDGLFALPANMTEPDEDA